MNSDALAIDTRGHTLTDLLASARSQIFQYDPLDRLTQAQRLYGTYAYGYDAVGNRLSRSLSGSPANFSEAYTYAPTSNQLQTVTAGATTRTLGYTAQGADLLERRPAFRSRLA